MRARSSVAVRAAGWLALAGTVHAAVNARLLRRPGAPAGEMAVSVLVPARNEAANIAGCVRTLLGPHEVLVLDDRSDDATAELAAETGARVLAGTPPPDGWLGKAWACAQLVEAADPDSDVLVFVDADVRLEPGAVAAAVGLLERHGLDIVCPVPRQLAQSPAERLVQPLVQWSWLTTLPLRVAERSPRPSLTAACGQFVVLRRAALARAGGFARVRADVLDDVALVRAVKAAGGRGGVADGSSLAGCRMYLGWAELRDGYSKSLWSAFGGDAGAAAVVAAMGFVWVLPAIAAVGGSRAGLAGYAAGVAGRVIAARSTGGRAVPDAFAHPLSVAVFGWLTARSVLLRRRGTLQWKGRPVAFAPTAPYQPRRRRSTQRR